MGKRNFTHSALMNNRTYYLYYNTLMELALARFEWHNLPISVDESFLELQLNSMGYAVYFNDEEMGNVALSCILGGELDVYNIPINRQAFSTNGYHRDLNKSDSVIIFNTAMHRNTECICRMYAYYMYEIQRALDINVKGQKTPKIILCQETQRLTFENLFMKYDGNEPFIYADKNLDIEQIKSLDTTNPYVGDRLETLKHQIWNEALTMLGIENGNQDKKERLVANEVGSNYGNVEACRFVYLNERNKAARKINEMFGQDIYVTFRSELTTTLNMPNLIKGGDMDECIYNASAMDSRTGSE